MRATRCRVASCRREAATIRAFAHEPVGSARRRPYLADEYGVAINAIFFRVFKDGDREYLSRAWLVDEVTVCLHANDDATTATSAVRLRYRNSLVHNTRPSRRLPGRLLSTILACGESADNTDYQ